MTKCLELDCASSENNLVRGGLFAAAADVGQTNAIFIQSDSMQLIKRSGENEREHGRMGRRTEKRAEKKARKKIKTAQRYQFDGLDKVFHLSKNPQFTYFTGLTVAACVCVCVSYIFTMKSHWAKVKSRQCLACHTGR